MNPRDSSHNRGTRGSCCEEQSLSRREPIATRGRLFSTAFERRSVFDLEERKTSAERSKMSLSASAENLSSEGQVSESTPRRRGSPYA